MRGSTTTKKQLAALAKQFNLNENQVLLDVHNGFGIVMDRGHEKFTVIAPNTEIRRMPPSWVAAPLWTVNLKAAYRAANEAGQLQKIDPILVIFREKREGDVEMYAVGHATIEAGRVVVKNLKTKKRAESYFHSIWHWTGTEAQAHAAVAAQNKDVVAYNKSLAKLKKGFGRHLRHLDDVALVQAKEKPTEYERQG